MSKSPIAVKAYKTEEGVKASRILASTRASLLFCAIASFRAAAAALKELGAKKMLVIEGIGEIPRSMVLVNLAGSNGIAAGSEKGVLGINVGMGAGYCTIGYTGYMVKGEGP